MASFGNRLKEMRVKKDVTLAKMANDLKSTEATLSRYENNKTEPNVTFLKEIAQYLNTSADYLIGLDTANIINDDEIPKEIVSLIRKHSLEDLEVIGFAKKKGLTSNQVKAIIDTYSELNKKIEETK